MRIGLLGTGPWAKIAYGPALRDHPSVELAGVWGRRPEAASAIASSFGGRPYDDVDALIEDVEAVAIALPPAVQAPLAARAALAGRHLLVDKPLALDVTDARAVADAAARTGVDFTRISWDGRRTGRRGTRAFVWSPSHSRWIIVSGQEGLSI